jgi:transcriptional regulator with XRE-family HTH domain
MPTTVRDRRLPAVCTACDTQARQSVGVDLQTVVRFWRVTINDDQHHVEQTPPGAAGNPHVPWERNFVSQMKFLRESRGWTQTDLARLIRSRSAGEVRFHQQTVQRIENGERPVRLNEALVIADALSVELHSMTVNARPSTAAIGYAAVGLQKASGRTADGLAELVHDWDAGVELLMSAVLDRMFDPPVEFGDDGGLTDAQIRRRAAEVRSSDLDNTTRWGLAWALKAASTFDAVRQAHASLVDLSGHDGSPLSSAVIETVRILRGAFESDAALTSDAALPGRELAVKMPISDQDASERQTS